MRIALYEPDIPQNLGSAIRLCACLDVALDIIEPCGFPLSDKAIKRAAMDYGQAAEVETHINFAAFHAKLKAEKAPSRLILFTTKSAAPYTQFEFRPDDILLFGRESAGVPQDVHDLADHRLFIPISAQTRSINVINSAAMALGEALRQNAAFPKR